MNGRNESPEEEADRQFDELLQELRVSQTGVQVLFSLLLTVPFTQRFKEITQYQRGVFFAALVLSALSVVMFVAPVSHHRLLFHRHEKAHLVRSASRFALIGQVLLWLAMTSVLLLISDVLFKNNAAEAFAAAFLVVTASVWFVAPLIRRFRGGTSSLRARRGAAGDRSPPAGPR